MVLIWFLSSATILPQHCDTETELILSSRTNESFTDRNTDPVTSTLYCQPQHSGTYELTNVFSPDIYTDTVV